MSRIALCHHVLGESQPKPEETERKRGKVSSHVLRSFQPTFIECPLGAGSIGSGGGGGGVCIKYICSLVRASSQAVHM